MASGTFKWYMRGLVEFMEGKQNWGAGTDYKVALFSASCTPSQDATHGYSDVSAYEVSGDGYTAGGKSLASLAATLVAASNIVKLCASDVAWTESSITGARNAIIYENDAINKRLIAYATFDADMSSVAGTFTLDFPSNVVLRITAS